MSNFFPAVDAFRIGKRGFGRGMPWNDCAPSRTNNVHVAAKFFWWPVSVRDGAIPEAAVGRVVSGHSNCETAQVVSALVRSFQVGVLSRR
jgi:hypothetical protein